MELSTEARDCFDLVVGDLRQALTADRLVSFFDANLPDDASADVLLGLYFVSGSLALRMALAVNRILQEPGHNRATLVRLLQLLKRDVAIDLTPIFNRAEAIRNSRNAILLKKCRDGFAAHTLLGEQGFRDGMTAKAVGDLLHELSDLISAIATAVGYEQFDGDTHFNRWHEIADKIARAIVAGTKGTLDQEIAAMRERATRSLRR